MRDISEITRSECIFRKLKSESMTMNGQTAQKLLYHIDSNRNLLTDHQNEEDEEELVIQKQNK